MVTAGPGHTATRLSNGKVLMTGGGGQYCGVGCVSPSAELYDAATGSFSASGSMTTQRAYGHTATLLPDSSVLVAAGDDGSCDFYNPLASAELYDAATSSFSATGTMATARSSHTATLLSNGKVLVVGGDGVTGSLANAELFDER